MRVVAPLDLLERQRYVKPVWGEYHEGDLDNIYNIYSQLDDYINPTVDDMLGWRSFKSCSSDSMEALENWHKKLHDVSMQKCAQITKSNDGSVQRYVMYLLMRYCVTLIHFLSSLKSKYQINNDYWTCMQPWRLLWWGGGLFINNPYQSSHNVED